MPGIPEPGFIDDIFDSDHNQTLSQLQMKLIENPLETCGRVEISVYIIKCIDYLKKDIFEDIYYHCMCFI